MLHYHRCYNKRFMSITKHRCRECEKIFDAEKSNARFCSSSCRQRDYRRRHAVKFKKQAETIKTQTEVISKITKKFDWWEKEQIRKAKHDAWLDKVLSGIILPSVSKYRAGKFDEYEIKEFTKTANGLGMTLPQYMEDLERRLINAHPDIAKGFE